ncbi:Hypothetical protein DHA2_152771 [Giardia duodenalis]|uniref:Uncharacterized protein n=1 Tax=Giardia intestinalis TaxID=5741 RepID=V6TKK8_GIAIN|nr:Hypothetical protein DHA2_152771 [Giardia intestinalis]
MNGMNSKKCCKMRASGRLLTLRDLSEVELEDIVFEKTGQSLWRARTGLETASRVPGNVTISGRIGSPRVISLKDALQLENHALATEYLLHRDPKPVRPASARLAKLFQLPANAITQRMIDERKDEANKLEQDVELLKRRINRLKLKQELEERSAKNMVTRLEEAQRTHNLRVRSQENQRLQREQREKSVVKQHKQNMEMALSIKENIRTRKTELEQSKRASVAVLRQELAVAHATLSEEYDRELEEKHQRIVQARIQMLDSEARFKARVVAQTVSKQEARKALLDAEQKRIRVSLKELVALQDREKAISDLIAIQRANKTDAKQRFTQRLQSESPLHPRSKSAPHSTSAMEAPRPKN